MVLETCCLWTPCISVLLFERLNSHFHILVKLRKVQGKKPETDAADAFVPTEETTFSALPKEEGEEGAPSADQAGFLHDAVTESPKSAPYSLFSFDRSVLAFTSLCSLDDKKLLLPRITDGFEEDQTKQPLLQYNTSGVFKDIPPAHQCRVDWSDGASPLFWASQLVLFVASDMFKFRSQVCCIGTGKRRKWGGDEGLDEGLGGLEELAIFVAVTLTCWRPLWLRISEMVTENSLARLNKNEKQLRSCLTFRSGMFQPWPLRSLKNQRSCGNALDVVNVSQLQSCSAPTDQFTMFTPLQEDWIASHRFQATLEC